MEHAAAREAGSERQRGDEAAIRARLELLEATYGTAFPPEGMEIARAAITGAAARAAALRAIPLANGDEPVGSFVPERATGRRAAS